MSQVSPDRNVLFGILAHQNALVSREQLLAGMQAWLDDKTHSLAEILCAQGVLDDPRRALLDALVDVHIQQHGGDLRQSLLAIGSVESVRLDLQELLDRDPQVTVSQFIPDPMKTQPDSVNPHLSGVGFDASAAVRFVVLRPHAKGGLGEVFVALDTQLNREVALKEIQGKYADDGNSRSRFLLEAEITGGLEHPSIVPVYGLGTYADGRPFYAMRFIRGDSLMEAIKKFHGEPIAAANRVEGQRSVEFHKLVGRLIDVCNALQYAHDRGVLHRDIKPGNIMLGKYGETLIVDWGLAKVGARPEPESLLHDEPPLYPASASGNAETQAGIAIGTPAFMSPEQAEGRIDTLGPATDVYSLGATLYCLLTGKAPASGPVVEVLNKVRTGAIASPRRLDPTIDPALEAVCLKAMALRAEDRYVSPLALSNDLEHWLAGEPVSAWPEPLGRRMRRWVNRHRTGVAAGAALLLAAVPLLTMLILLSEGARNELEKEQARTNEALVATKKLANANQKLAEDEIAARLDADRRREQAEALAVRIEFEHYFAKVEQRPDLALVGWARLLPRAARLKDPSLTDELRLHIAAWHGQAAELHAVCGHPDKVVAATLSADGRLALTGSMGNAARLWETATGKQVGPLLQHQGEVRTVALDADGKTALTGSFDSTAQLWETATGKPIGPPLQHRDQLLAVVLSADGKTALTGSKDSTARLWDAKTGIPIGPALEHQGRVNAVALSSDGAIALTGSDDKTARLWSVATGKPIGPPLQHQDLVTTVALSADGKTALTGSRDNKARLWQTATGTPIATPLVHQGWIRRVLLSADGSLAITAGNDKTARLWESATGKQIGASLPHLDDVLALALSADGKTLLTGSSDRMARLWEVPTGNPIGPPMLHQNTVGGVAMSNDGRTLLTGSLDGNARIWTNPRNKTRGSRLRHQGIVYAVALSDDGKTAISGSSDKSARVWDTATAKPIGKTLKHQAAVAAVALSADGSKALTGSLDRTAQLWDTATGTPIGPRLRHQHNLAAVAISSDGKLALTASEDKTAQLWDGRTGKPIGPPLQHDHWVVGVALSADGRLGLTGSYDTTARLWNTATGEPLQPKLEHQAGILAVALSDDGAIALTGSFDKTARLWTTATGKPIGPPLKHLGKVLAVALSVDGSLAMTGSSDKTAQVWNAVTGAPIGAPLQHLDSVVSVAFSADGKFALTASSDKTARLWETATGKPIGPPLPHFNKLAAGCLSRSGNIALTGGYDKTARLWKFPTPIRGDPQRILLWTQVITGLEVTDLTASQILDSASWRQRWLRLQELGGPPPTE